MPKIITVGGNVVTTLSGGTTYALSTSGGSNAVPTVSGYAFAGIPSGSTNSAQWTVAIPADAVQIEGTVYVTGDATVPGEATAGESVLSLSICGVTVLTKSGATPGTTFFSGTCVFCASRANVAATSWTVNCFWVTVDGTGITSGTGSSPTSFLRVAASNNTHHTGTAAGTCSVQVMGSANYTMA